MHALLSHPITKRLKSCAVVAPLVAAAAFLDAGHAQAVVVTVGGNDYDVSYFNGAYSDNISSFNTTDMPWWGNSDLAQSFAVAVGLQLGPVLDSQYGPLFAYETRSFGNIVGWINDGGSTAFTGRSESDTLPYAFVQPEPVPGPLPVFGAAAAFGWSRQMRRRLKGGTEAS